MKTKYFFYAILSFLVVGYTVYSWTEPTTMPSSYNPPINTSITAQTKMGEIGASVFRDADDSSYYINPSGNSIVSGTISAANPTANNHIATKEYIDGLLENVVPEITSLSNTMHKIGINPVCPDNSVEIIRYWAAKSCSTVNQYGNVYGCTTGNTSFWGESAPTCTYNDYNYNNNVHSCTADQSQGVLCATTEESFLINSIHTESQCNIIGGDVVTVESNIKICKFYNSQTCPSGWTQYNNWSKTEVNTVSYQMGTTETICSCTTGSHVWSNTAREKCSIGYQTRYKKPDTCPSPSRTCTRTNEDFYLLGGCAAECTYTVCGHALVKEIGCY